MRCEAELLPVTAVVLTIFSTFRALIPGRKDKRWLGNAAKLPPSMLVVAHPRFHSEESGEQLGSFETRLQVVLECVPRAILPCRGASTKRKGYGRTTSGHPSKS